MGRYLTVNGIENNAKSISYPMMTLIREICTGNEDVANEEMVFILSTKEVTSILQIVIGLLEDDGLMKEYVAGHFENYGMNQGLEEVKRVFKQIYTCFEKALSEMNLHDMEEIFCYWI